MFAFRKSVDPDSSLDAFKTVCFDPCRCGDCVFVCKYEDYDIYQFSSKSIPEKKISSEEASQYSRKLVEEGYKLINGECRCEEGSPKINFKNNLCEECHSYIRWKNPQPQGEEVPF